MDTEHQSSSNHLLVSVVIPTYARPRQLRGCLEDLAQQTLDPDAFEVVVVDDGSPEGVGALAQAFAGRLHIRVFRQVNAGPGAARNRGASEAAGALIAFTDDDCRPSPAWLETMLAGERSRPGALVGGSTRNGLSHRLFSEASQWIVDMVYEHFNRNHENAYFFASNNIAWGRESYQAIGGFDQSFPRAGAEDRDFCDRWRAAGMPLIWRPAASIEHFHPQTLASFLDLHYRYGRGAWTYHSKRRLRSTGTMSDDLGFHATLPRSILRGLARYPGAWRKLQFCSALLLWQRANVAGFATESLASRVASRDPSSKT